MKLVGITSEGITLKSDSSLQVNKKPFFVPSFSEHFTATPCLVYRINRVGKSIQSKFAYRYINAVTVGLDIIAEDCTGVEHNAFDYSLVVGTMQPIQETIQWSLSLNNSKYTLTSVDFVTTYMDAIARISSLLTLRQGDFLFIDHRTYHFPLHIDDEYIVPDILYCKIK